MAGAQLLPRHAQVLGIALADAVVPFLHHLLGVDIIHCAQIIQATPRIDSKSWMINMLASLRGSKVT